MAEFRKRHGITVLGHRKAAAASSTRLEVAGPDSRVASGDVLILVGETPAIERLVTQMGE